MLTFLSQEAQLSPPEKLDRYVKGESSDDLRGGCKHQSLCVVLSGEHFSDCFSPHKSLWRAKGSQTHFFTKIFVAQTSYILASTTQLEFSLLCAAAARKGAHFGI